MTSFPVSTIGDWFETVNDNRLPTPKLLQTYTMTLKTHMIVTGLLRRGKKKTNKNLKRNEESSCDHLW